MHVSKVAQWAPSGTDSPATAISTSVVASSSILTLDSASQNVLVSVYGADVMVTFDGTDPASNNGHPFYDGDREVWSKQAWTKARFIRKASTDAVVHATPGCPT